MANEIRITSSLRYALNQASASLSTSFAADQTGSKYEAGVQTVGITEEVLSKNDVGTIGYAAFRNTDATNFVEFGGSTGVYSVHLDAGEGCVVPWKHSNVYALSNVAPCAVEYLLIES